MNKKAAKAEAPEEKAAPSSRKDFPLSFNKYFQFSHYYAGSSSSSHSNSARYVALKQLQIFLITYLGYSCIYLTRKPFSIAKSYIEKECNISKSQLAQIDTSFLMMYAIGQFFSGALGKLLGTKLVLFLGYFLSALTCCAFGVANLDYAEYFKSKTAVAMEVQRSEDHSFHFSQEKPPLQEINVWFLTLLWGLNGFVQSGAFPMMTNIIYSFFPKKHQGAVMGVWCTCQQVGGILSTIIPAILAERFCWRFAFIIPSFIVFLYSFIFIFIDENKEEKFVCVNKAANASSTSESAEKSKIIETKLCEKEKNVNKNKKKQHFAEVLFLPNIFNLSAAYFFVKLVRYVIIMWLPYYLSTNLNYNPYTTTTITTVFDLGGLFGCMASGYISDRFVNSRRSFVVIPMCFLAASMCFLYASTSNTTSSLLNGVIICIFGTMIAGPDSMLGGILVADLCNKYHCSYSIVWATGIVNGFGSLGVIFQGLITSSIVDIYGWETFFKALSLVAFLPVFILLPLMRQEIYSKSLKRD